MKHFVTADEIRQLAASGERELMLREHTVLTDAAVDAVRLHGIRLVEGSTYSTADPPPQAVPAPRGAGGLPAPALAGLVRARPGATPSPQVRHAEGSGTVPVTGPPDSGRLLTRLLIGGEWVEAAGGATVPTVDPATNRTIADVAAAQPGDVDKAVRAARAAFPAWRDLDPDKRARLMLRLAELIEDERDYLAQVESHDVGKPIREAALVDLPACWDPWRFFAGAVRTVAGRVLALPRTSLDYVRREPTGVVGMIIPWNFPLHIACRKGSAALAAGNTVVLKAPELAPLTSLELGRLALEAGIPPGVFNVVPGLGEVAGAALVEHPDVNKIAFTGSTTTGRAVMRGGAGTIKRVSLELGGKSPSIVFADADLDRAVTGSVFGIYLAQGEVCSAGSRVLVERPVHDEFVSRFAERARRIRVGLPHRWETQLGALINRRQCERVYEYVGIGTAEGATVVTGGVRPDDPELAEGNFIQPTVLAGVRNDMRIAQEEIFGPVVVIIPFDGEEEAIRLANDVRYGLAAGIWTADGGRAHRVAHALDAGSIWVNHYGVYPSEAPFGGYKESGTGHDLGLESLDEYTEVKNVHVNIGTETFDWYA
ncbi:MAG TPA: aldehyde dehydrogenase family protein [Gaiellales bacterium]|nr:aldehyde dehydrogenase family protein [Gaiellales bacterium]